MAFPMSQEYCWNVVTVKNLDLDVSIILVGACMG